MLLYDSDVSGNCYKVRLLLAHLGLEYQRFPVDVVDRSNRQEVLGELNPGLRVPTLVLDDERALGESGAILWYLADGTEYLPADPFDRAKVLQWMFFEQYSHEPYVAVARFWLTKGIDVEPEALAERQRAGYLALDAIEAHLAGHELSSPSATRSPTSRSTPTRTSPTRAASTSAATRRSAPGSTAWLLDLATSRSTPESGTDRGN